MAENSSIEWCDHTFNPWIGCSKVSAGCTHCYAETLMDTRMGKAKWGPRGTRVRTSEAYWKQPLRWNKKALKEGRRYRVFCASLADVFEDRPELAPWRNELFALIDATPHLDWLLLTKRPENIVRMWAGKQPNAEQLAWAEQNDQAVMITDMKRDNVWLGTSVEDQAAADERIPHLLAAAHLCRYTFLSCEPLLGPVDLGDHICQDGGCGCSSCEERYTDHSSSDFIHWVIAGGESGPKARPMYLSWARSLREQCKEAGVPFFFKQWGCHLPAGQTATQSGLWNPSCGSTLFTTVKNAGRLLDGQEHNAFPE